jgi:phage baseplate assembly protein W
MTTRAPAVINFGTCWGTPNGQDLSMPSYMATGNQVVAEAVLRRWATGQGELIDDPNYGYNVMDLVSADLSPRDIAYAQQQLAAEAQKDERVRSASVVLVMHADGTLDLTASVVTAAGPFRLVVAVSATSVTLLLVSP